MAETLTGADVVRMNRDYTLFSWAVQGPHQPTPVARAKGVYFWDYDGKRYLDFSSQLMNTNIGHQHPKVVAAIQEQAAKLTFVHPSLATEPRGRLGQMLAELAPGDLQKSFFTLGGAEAIENAVKIARAVTGRHKIISRHRSYHGATYGAISLSGDPRRFAAEPGIPGNVKVLDPHCYRCPFGQQPESCRRECISHVEQILQFENPESVAAIIMEGVTGSSGLIIPPPDYWPRMREICDKYGILLIADEVMSGFGRTGKWFAINNWNVVPDMICMAKGLTSGYLPLGNVMVSKKIAEHFDTRMLNCGLTYSAHTLACATAIATLEVMKEERIVERSAEMGEVLAAHLRRMYETHPSVGDVRSIGLFGVIELVKDRKTREPMAPWNAKPSEMGPMLQIAARLKELGMHTFVRWNWIFTVPPLVISEAELEEGFAMIDDALRIADKALPARA